MDRGLARKITGRYWQMQKKKSSLLSVTSKQAVQSQSTQADLPQSPPLAKLADPVPDPQKKKHSTG